MSGELLGVTLGLTVRAAACPAGGAPDPVCGLQEDRPGRVRRHLQAAAGRQGGTSGPG